MGTTAPAGWHKDPTELHQHRYWDGNGWTEHVADNGVPALDPLPSHAPPEKQVDVATSIPASVPADRESTPIVAHRASAPAQLPVDLDEAEDLLMRMLMMANAQWQSETFEPLIFRWARLAGTPTAPEEMMTRLEQAPDSGPELLRRTCSRTSSRTRGLCGRSPPCLATFATSCELSAATSLAKLPSQTVLFGNETGQVTAGWLANNVERLC